MAYIFRRESRRAPSDAGGKDYHLVLVSDRVSNATLLISRWAKAGQWGNGLKVERFDRLAAAEKHWRLKEREKFQREYAEEIAPYNQKILDDVNALKKALGPQYWSKLGNHLEWLIPGIGKGEETPAEPIWDDKESRFRSRPKATKPGVFKFEEKPVDEQTIEEEVKENPLWGSW